MKKTLLTIALVALGSAVTFAKEYPKTFTGVLVRADAKTYKVKIADGDSEAFRVNKKWKEQAKEYAESGEEAKFKVIKNKKGKIILVKLISL